MNSIKKILFLLGVVILGSSFSEFPGGEGYEIYLNNQLLVRQFGQQTDHISTFSLDQAQPTDKLVIRYYHCGQAGKNRVVFIKEAGEKTIKTFHYPNTTSNSGMEVPLTEIVIRKTKMQLWYSSDQLPKGRELMELKKSGTGIAVK